MLLIRSCFPTPRGGFDFGSATLPWADIYFAGSSSNPASNNFELTGISTSGTRVITFPDSSGIVTLTSDTLGAFSATTSSQLAGVISDETGNGALVFANNPSLITPALGVATATSINKLTLTTPVTGATLTIDDGFTLHATGNVTALSGSHTGTSSGTNTGDQTTITGNAGTATALQTARLINGVSFNGTADITVTAAAGTLTGVTLNSGVTASSLTSVGTLSSLVLSGAITGATGYNGLVVTPNTGVVTTGTWNGTAIAVANGGTGQTTYTNGELLIGNTTGNTLTKATLIGTANQVVTNGTGSITLSTPQNIHTSATPQFSRIGIGTGAGTAVGLYLGNATITSGTTQYGVDVNLIFGSDATTAGYGFVSVPYTAVASFTIPNFYHYAASNISLGAGSAVTTQYGFYVADLTSGTSNRAFQGDISSGSSKYNLYMNGTADNYIRGNVGIGAVPVYALDVIENTTTNVYTAEVSRSMTLTSGTQAIMNLNGLVAPTGASSTNYFGLITSIDVEAAISQNFSGLIAAYGTNSSYHGTGTLATFEGIRENHIHFPGAGAITTSRTFLSNAVFRATTTTAIGYDSLNTFDNASSAVTTFVHFRANATGTITAGGAVTNTYGLQVGNLGKTGVANAAGIAVNAQSGASTGNVDLLLGILTVPAVNAAIYAQRANPDVFLSASTTSTTTVGDKDSRIVLLNNSNTANAGGEIVLGAAEDTTTERYASIGTDLKQNAAGGSIGDVYIATKTATGDTALIRRFVVQANGYVGINDTTPDAMLDIVNLASTDIGLIIEAAASQSANLQEWRNSSGTPLIMVSGAGLFGVGATSSSALAHFGGGTNPLTGVTQVGVLGNITGTSTATSAVRALQGILTTAASTTVAEASGLVLGAIDKGSGGTITRGQHLWISETADATNNADLVIAPSLTYTGNWAIYLKAQEIAILLVIWELVTLLPLLYSLSAQEISFRLTH